MRPEGSRGGGIVVVVVTMLLLALPALYVLSIGPAAWLFEREYISQLPLEVIYTPITLVADYCPPVADGLERYVDLWISPSTAPPPSSVPAPPYYTPAAS